MVDGFEDAEVLDEGAVMTQIARIECRASLQKMDFLESYRGYTGRDFLL